MINGNITNYITVHSGTFSINTVFDTNVMDFTKSDITFRAVSGNGISDLTFSEIIGVGSSYMLTVTVPSGVVGAFSVEIDGQVSVSGESQAVESTSHTFNYDTVPDITTTMKSVDYQQNDEIGGLSAERRDKPTGGVLCGCVVVRQNGSAYSANGGRRSISDGLLHYGEWSGIPSGISAGAWHTRCDIGRY